jgi:hypothetical protein
MENTIVTFAERVVLVIAFVIGFVVLCLSMYILVGGQYVA